jgi:nephrocystin-3
MSSTAAPISRVVRVFISSTFRDFGVERDLLMKRVFPELRRRARDRFVEVIGVDLRWGITEEQSQKGETLPICLREIERSRPYFIGLLGERYGWTPAAGQYPENLLAQQPWLGEHAGGKSVTELEILYGVLNAPEMAGRAYFYFRDSAWSEGRGGDYRSEGVDERAKLGRLKERIRSSEFPSVEYSTPEALADRITDDLWKLIDAEYPEDQVPDELERERRSHEAYAHERKRLYVGQDETVAALLARIEGASDEKGEEGSRSRTTLVTGESGTGKSALLANVLARYRESHPTHVVIEHYIGSTSDASDPAKLMRRVAGEIKKLMESSREIEDDPEKLAEQFAEWLAEASWWARGNERIVVLALDALDKLSDEARLRWLPKITAPHLRIVMSSLAGESRAVVEERGVESVEAKPFTHEVARNYIVETLARCGRRLPECEVDRIVAHSRATLPIYLKTLVEELSVFGSHEGLSQRITECLAAQEPDDLFEVILARLEEDLGRDAVKKLLEAIWASSEGMSEDELIGFTGVSPLELARLRLSLDDAVYESGGLVRLAHAYMSKAVEDRYLPTEEQRRELHKTLGLWWEGREATPRMGWSVDLHLYRAEAWDDLERCLTSPRTAAAVLSAVDVYSVYRSWSEIADARGAKSVGKFIGPAIQSQWSHWQSASRHDEVAWLTVSGALLNVLLLSGSHETGELVAKDRLILASQLSKSADCAKSLSDEKACIDDLVPVLLARGDLESALLQSKASLLIARRFVDGQRPLGRLFELQVSLDAVAHCLLDLGDTKDALRHGEESLEIARELAERQETPTRLINLCLALGHVGNIFYRRGDLGGLKRFEEALGISNRLLEYEVTPDRLEIAQNNLREVANGLRKKGDFAGALQRGEESLAIAQRLVEIEETPGRLYRICVSLTDLGETLICSGLQNLGDSFARFEESLRVARRLVDVDKSPDWMSNLATVLCHLGTAYRYMGELDEALGCFRESIEIRWGLVKAKETPNELREIGVILNHMADTLAFDDSETTGQLYEESLAISRRLVETAYTPQHVHDLSFCLGRVGRFLRMNGDLYGSLEHREESLAHLTHLRDFDLLQPSWFEDFVCRLEEVLHLGIELGEYARVHERAVERWELATAQAEDDETIRILETLLSYLTPLMLCEIELGKFEDADESAAEVERLVDAIASAFDDSSIDREEEQLDATTLYRCAKGMDLVARLRGAQDDVNAEAASRAHAAELRERAEALKAEDDVAEEDESDSDDEAT